jgi:hypothetical protein
MNHPEGLDHFSFLCPIVFLQQLIVFLIIHNKEKTMKTVIMIFVLIFSFSLYAQENTKSASADDQSNEWMIKIAADPENRVKIMDMMIEQTKGNKEEMMKLVNSISLSQDMLDMIIAQNRHGSENQNTPAELSGIKKDSSKFKPMEYVKPIKKNEIK